ncbi:hypothetical protein V7S43_000569 [Phytophthora oleae]|uniref:BED-type domain-containing protein n=1 Tax=Phytophthora oleae TaxID=2107226 RepID=A0ABD3G639_9STRA
MHDVFRAYGSGGGGGGSGDYDSTVESAGGSPSSIESPTPSSSPEVTQTNTSLRLFEMRKQKKRAHWQFIRCVADEAFADIPEDQLRTKHAKHGWCTVCNMVVKVEKGKSNAGQHMQEFHEDALLAFQRQEEAEQVARDDLRLRNAYEEPHTEPSFERQAASAEQHIADDLLAMWIASSLRTFLTSALAKWMKSCCGFLCLTLASKTQSF